MKQTMFYIGLLDDSGKDKVILFHYVNCLLTNQLNNSRERSLPWEANSRSTNHKIPSSFMETEVSLSCSVEPATGP